MRSLAAWGSRPIKVNNSDQVVHVHLDGAIGIDYDEATEAIKVAVCYRSANDPNKFTKAESYRRLNTRLDVARPSTLLWQGTWEGDPNKVKTELFAALTKFAKTSIFISCSTPRFKAGNLSNVHRSGDLVTNLNGMILSWLVNNPNVTGDFKFTEMGLLPHGQEIGDLEVDVVTRYFKDNFDFVIKVQDHVDKLMKGETSLRSE